ncbi:hypothetical protein Psta_3497 [Pirellula staleyi DSM 6068]|uniref:Uncharacterized protein n=1 Tax=Pirellula staleyi (strain ATCC 27377 / DSM 6068 / ICPB 4128) TaxID=530564 RepID=D2QYJ9_PIRSD|nr:hypothetical protein Psta_3497 [Pirellula staleyi DSM 6068]
MHPMRTLLDNSLRVHFFWLCLKREVARLVEK